jgi:alpha-amylase/alpha-mannosidase (GH57 family)
VAARPILLVLVWHMHQPSYVHATSGKTLLPWARLHATKDYRDMVDVLRSFPRVHATFNLTPVLLDQIERIAAGEPDEVLRLARLDPAALSPEDRAAILRDFFHVHRERMLEPHARYRELFHRAAEERSGGAPLTPEELRDIQVWFHLAWTDPSYGAEEPIRSLLAKGRGFTEREKEALLEWGRALAGTVITAYREAAVAGQIELSTSAHYHPILPLLVDTDAPREVAPSLPLPTPPFRAPEDAEAQLRSARATHTRRFGAAPRGTWPPEGAVSEAALALIRAQGFTWAASDESVLARALELRDGDSRDWPAGRYKPYRVETPSGPLLLVFRDRTLSDRIGFVYQRWDPVEAADDFMEQIRSAAAHAKGDRPALVTVILDGENCWEGYEEDGRPFLAALYERLEMHPSIEALTVTEALERMAPADELQRIPVGSWIRDDLAIWIGHPEKNAAWDELRDARSLLRARGAEAPREAWEALYAAEGSDWFWWYGDDHKSDQRDVFDVLFRENLMRVYAALSAVPPESLRSSLLGKAGTPGVGSWTAGEGEGAMHRTTGFIAAVRFSVEGGMLRVRVVPRPGAAGRDAALVFRFGEEGAVAARLFLDGLAAGPLSWDRGGAGGGEEPGSYARGDSVAVQIPLGRVPRDAKGEVVWRVELEHAGRAEERAPRDGWFRTRWTGADSAAASERGHA